MVGLANRPGGYDTELNVFLGPALTACSSIIEAVRSEQHRRLSEEGLRKSEERYRGLVEDMPALVCRFRLDGTLTFVNSSYCSHFNREPEELIGRNFFSFIPEPEREDVRTHFMSLNQGRPAVTYEHQIVLPEGAVRWQEWTGRVLFGEGGDPAEFQSLGRDVTPSGSWRKKSSAVSRPSSSTLRNWKV
jgi:PAS domain S-box-containing protein